MVGMRTECKRKARRVKSKQWHDALSAIILLRKGMQHDQCGGARYRGTRILFGRSARCHPPPLPPLGSAWMLCCFSHSVERQRCFSRTGEGDFGLSPPCSVFMTFVSESVPGPLMRVESNARSVKKKCEQRGREGLCFSVFLASAGPETQSFTISMNNCLPNVCR